MGAVKIFDLFYSIICKFLSCFMTAILFLFNFFAQFTDMNSIHDHTHILDSSTEVGSFVYIMCTHFPRWWSKKSLFWFKSPK